MRMRTYYILRDSSHEESSPESPVPETKHGAEEAKEVKKPEVTAVLTGGKKEFWDDPEYQKYKEKHGVHFNDTLAMWASKHLDNKHGDKNHTWSVEEVKAAYSKLGLLKPEHVTWGDAAFAANSAYANFYGETLRTDIDVLRHSNADISNMQGYSGQSFNRWLSDVMGLGTAVPWKDFIY